jgi:putative toxin-antitoxin system antitoxin component (TIGR02293 family)
MGHLAYIEIVNASSAFVLAELPSHDLVQRIRRGLPAKTLDQVSKALGISKTVLAQKLGIARRTVSRKNSEGKPLSPDASEKVLRTARILNLAKTIFTTDEAISQWLSQPDRALGDSAPFDLLDTDVGARDVENLMRALTHGHFV